VGFIVKYSSEQRLISFSENVSDRGNAIGAAFAASQKGQPQKNLYTGGL